MQGITGSKLVRPDGRLSSNYFKSEIEYDQILKVL